MKHIIKESGLRDIIFNKVMTILNEGIVDGMSEAHFLNEQKYGSFIRKACHIIAWKGTNFDINIGGPEFQNAMILIDDYNSLKNSVKQYLKQHLKPNLEPEELNVIANQELKKAKAYFASCHRGVGPAIVGSERSGFELFKQFKEEGLDFIEKYLGSKDNESKQREKQAGLALFGADDTGLSEKYIKYGAVFCVRDFCKWVEAGKPEQMEFGGTINKKNKSFGNDNSDSQDPFGGEDFLRKVEDVINNRRYSSAELSEKLGVEQRVITACRKKINGGYGKLGEDVLLKIIAGQIKESNSEDALDELQRVVTTSDNSNNFEGEDED